MKLDSLPETPTVAVVDVSFISLTQVFPALAKLIAHGARCVVLIKPQFEVGKGNVGKGGVVRDETARAAAVERVLASATSSGFVVDGVRESPVTGADGNVEYVSAGPNWKNML